MPVRTTHMLLVALLAIATALCTELPATWGATQARVEVQHESEVSETHASVTTATLTARGRGVRRPITSLNDSTRDFLDERTATTLFSARAYAAFASREPAGLIIPLRC